MRDQHPSPVPDYTNAFLTTLGGILFMGLLVISSLAGMVTALVVATLLDRGFQYFARD